MMFGKDTPDISHRAYYLDQTRGRVLHLDELKKFVDKLAFYGYNEFQIYIEHTYAFKCVPQLWEDEDYYTQEDIRELDRYCSKRGIELIPSLSCFGHLYKLLRLEKYRKYCELGDDESDFSFFDRMQHHTMAVIEPEGLELIKDMLSEFMALFTSDKVNICCDETFDLCEGKSKALLQKMTKKEAYINYVKSLCEFVVEKGRVPMIWGDVISGDTELFKLLPPETICLSWGYGTSEKDTNIKALSESGIRQYVCPGVCGWNLLINHIENSYINIKTMCSYAHKYHAEGIMVTDWGDYGHVNHPCFSVPGMIFGAMMSWNKDMCEKSFDELCKEISALEYKDPELKAVSFLDRAARQQVIEWGQLVRIHDLSEWPSDSELSVLKEKVKTASAEIEKIRVESKENPIYTKVFENALWGIDVINRAALGLCLRDCDKQVSSELGAWFDEYKEIFLENSKPSDINKVHEIIKWCQNF